MITHVVLFRPKADLPPAQREELLNSLRTALQAIPSISSARFGRRVLVDRAYEQLMTTHYEYAAMLDFESQTGLRDYLDHPAHEALAAAFFVSVQESLIYDFEVGEGTDGLERLSADWTRR